MTRSVSRKELENLARHWQHVGVLVEGAPREGKGLLANPSPQWEKALDTLVRVAAEKGAIKKDSHMAIARKMMMARSSAERRKIIKGRGFFDFIKNVGSTIWKGVKAAAPILLPAAGAALIAATGGAAAPAVLAAGAGGAASGLASKLGAGPEVQAVTGLATSAAAEAAARHLTRGTVSTGQKRF